MPHNLYSQHAIQQGTGTKRKARMQSTALSNNLELIEWRRKEVGLVLPKLLIFRQTACLCRRLKQTEVQKFSLLETETEGVTAWHDKIPETGNSSQNTEINSLHLRNLELNLDKINIGSRFSIFNLYFQNSSSNFNFFRCKVNWCQIKIQNIWWIRVS